MSASTAAVSRLETRVERLEAHQARIQSDVAAHLRRADGAIEDIVAALEVLRARVEALETARAADRT